MDESLKAKTLKGVSWSFIDNVVGSGITFLVGLVLAHLLTPAEFGMIGMITMFIAISNSIVDCGFSNALIRKINAEKKDYDTVFIFNLVISSLLYFVLFFAAPSISRFYKESQLAEILRVIGVTLILNAASIIQRTLLVKEVNFRAQAKISLISCMGSGIIGIGMALKGMGVWSLIGQLISRQLLNSALLWFFSYWRPALVFSIKSFKELFGFGSKLMISGIIDTIYQNFYYLIIGKFYTASQLGQYTRAEQFKNVFSQNLTAVVQRVSYPVLSSIQNDKNRLLVGYRKIIKATMLITFALMLGMFAVAKPMILILIGEKWLPSVIYLQIMCFAAMLYPLHAINLNILQVKGRTDLFLRLEIVKKMIAILPITLGIFMGIEYLLIGSVFISLISFFLNTRYSAPLIGYPPLLQLKDIFPSFFVSLFVSSIMWLISFLPWSNWVILFAQLTIGLGLSIIIFEKVGLQEYIEIRNIALLAIKKNSKKNGQK